MSRVLILTALLVVLPTIAIAERFRDGSGRVVAVTAIKILAKLCGIQFETVGADRLPTTRSYLFVPNHASPIDVAAVLVAHPGARFVAASELFNIPLLGPAMRALGTVAIDRRDRRAAHARIVELSQPEAARDLVIFAEGGIAPPGTVLPFKGGPFRIAATSGAAVVPVAISGSAAVLPPRGRLRVQPGVITVELLEPMLGAGPDIQSRRSLAREARSAVVEALAIPGQ